MEKDTTYVALDDSKRHDHSRDPAAGGARAGAAADSLTNRGSSAGSSSA